MWVDEPYLRDDTGNHDGFRRVEGRRERVMRTRADRGAQHEHARSGHARWRELHVLPSFSARTIRTARTMHDPNDSNDPND
jgi:hypothetical protein